MKIPIRRLTLCAFLCAVALALSFFESQLPSSLIPLPGVKLGLSNIVTLFALYSLGLKPAAGIVFCRCILSSFFGGGISALAFSLFGGAFAIFFMWLAMKCGLFSIFGVSLAGAAAHGIGQIVAACIMLGSLSAIFYLPILLFASLITGAVIAFITAFLLRRIPKKMYKS